MSLRSAILAVNLLLLGTSCCLAGNILILHPVYSGSHVLALRTVSNELGERGHKVTILRWNDVRMLQPPSNDNVTEIVLSVDNSDGKYALLTPEKEGRFQMPSHDLWQWGLLPLIVPFYNGYAVLNAQCHTLLQNKALIDKLRKTKYDIAVVDLVFNECSLALAHHLNLPTVGYWGFSATTGEPDLTTATLPASHVPSVMTRYSDRMTFFQRMYNWATKFGVYMITQAQVIMVDRVVSQYLSSVPSTSQLLADLSGMIINTDYAMDYPRALPPTFINVGGLQIRPVRPLPPEIEGFISDPRATNVVLFTMGYIFDSSVVPTVQLQAFLDAFRRMPRTHFVFKWDAYINETILPPNVRAFGFLPQQDILAHPKTVAFISHCGMHGLMEAIYYGVPVVGMPIFLDQADLLLRIVDRGIAVGLDKSQSTSNDIYHALQKIIHDPSYRNNVKRLSALMRDTMDGMPPRERAIWLLEYVMRHKGAEHLKLSSRHLYFWQYYCLDVIFVFIVIAVILCVAVLRTYRIAFRSKTNRVERTAAGAKQHKID